MMTATVDLVITDDSARTLSAWFGIGEQLTLSAVEKLCTGQTRYRGEFPLAVALSMQKVLESNYRWWTMN